MTLPTKTDGDIIGEDDYNGIVTQINRKVPVYDAIVYQDATTTYAVDKEGTLLSSVLISAATDDVPIKAAIAYLDALNASVLYGGHLHINTGLYKISTELTVVKPHTITGSSPTSTVLQTTTAITLFNVNPTTSAWEYERFTLRDLKLDGNSVGLYGVTFGTVASINLKVVKSNFDNLYIEKFANYGVCENSNWGSVYTNVFFKCNGISVAPPTAINTDSGGISVAGNAHTFIGCAFDWNTCGIVLKNGTGSSFYNTVVEGNMYHGIYQYPGSWCPFMRFCGIYLELNGEHNNLYPASPESLYDIYTSGGSSAAYWDIQNVCSWGTYVTNCGLLAGNYNQIRNFYNGNSKTLVMTGTGGVSSQEFGYLSGLQSKIDAIRTSKNDRNVLRKNQANACEDGTTTGFEAHAIGSTISAEPTGTTAAWQGSYSLKVVTPNTIPIEGGRIPLMGGIKPSSTYTFSLYAKGASGGEIITARIISCTSGGTQITPTDGNAVTLTTDYQRVSVTAPMEENAGAIRLYFTTTTQQAATFYVDGLQLEEDSTATTWQIPETHTTDGATATVADGGTITHGLGTTPTWATCTSSVSGEFISVTALAATTFTVAIKKHDGSAGTTQTVYWRCGV